MPLLCIQIITSIQNKYNHENYVYHPKNSKFSVNVKFYTQNYEKFMPKDIAFFRGLLYHIELISNIEKEEIDLSEPKLISPMLDNFAMGEPISNHHGVRCCPAMQQDSDERYIVKVISIPASQVQLDALLLTGAYENTADALRYFKTLSDDVVEEVNVLSRLSSLEGFVSYNDCQVVQMENEVGYDVYLLSPYRRTLARQMQKKPMTHLALVNLGLDICAALAVCRQAGYLYVDLKPENIYLTGDKEYRIGDLGFVKLDSLKYASLPDKYRSAYTAPELADAFSSINTTVDIYAAGMVLYQAYNGGLLPKDDGEESSLQSPAYADYEMAEIIMKAIDPNPENRWQDPIAMGQAIVSYMQRNGVNDDPIVPPAPVVEEEVLIDNTAEEESVTENTAEEEITISETTIENSEDAQGQVCISAFLEDAASEPESAIVEETSSSDEDTEAPESVPAEDSETVQSEDAENLSFLDEIVADDTLPSDETVGDISYEEISDDVSDMLSQADELIAHETPEPVVAPEPIDVQLPIQETVETSVDDSDISDENTNDSTASEDPEDAAEQINAGTPDDDSDQYDEGDTYEPLDKKSGKRLVAILIALILLAGLVFGGYIYYRDYYLQSVTSMTLSGSEDQLIVNISTEVDESLLTVVCTDIHGTKMEQSVTDGVAVFSGLNPNTLYTVKVKVSGLRKLTGDVSQNYSTPNQTSIVNLSAVTGTEEGSVIISFNVEGTEPESWKITYADGSELNMKTFTEHMVTINGLTVGETYVFQLESESAAFLSGNTQVEYTAAAPVYAENLALSLLDSSSIQVTWNSPSDSLVSKWIVRCYNETGYNESVTTAETSVTFTNMDCSTAHTIEVIAEGMSAGIRNYITEGAVTLDTLEANLNGSTLSITWKPNKAAANAKWMLVYSIEGIGQQEIIRSNSASASISPVIPGCTYNISVQLEDGTSVLGGNLMYEVPGTVAFNGHDSGYIVSDVNIQFSMCKQPANANWSYRDVTTQNYTTSYAPGEKAGFVMYIPSRYNTSGDNITSLIVIRDQDGNVISHSASSQPWRDMWYQRYGALNVQSLPEEAGNYTAQIYFNGKLAHTQEFTVA